MKIKSKVVKEGKGNYAYMVTWIALGDFLTTRHFATKEEALSQICWLKELGRQGIALYRMHEWGEVK